MLRKFYVVWSGVDAAALLLFHVHATWRGALSIPVLLSCSCHSRGGKRLPADYMF